MADVVIVEAVRAPIGRRNGGLASMHSIDLLAAVQREVIERSGIDPLEVGQVVGGCVGQVGMQTGNVTRTAWLNAGLPIDVAATTVDTQCGSSQQATNLAYAFKNHFKRPRPYQIVKDLQPCLVKPGYDESYPSGHAALGAIGGCLLAQRFPDKAYYLEQQGRIVGDLRVIGGVHNPSDVVAGQSLARQICDRLLSNPSFRRDFGLTR